MAAQLGGAGGIIANGAQDISVIKRQINLPIIGVINRQYNDSELCLRPAIADIHELMAAEPGLISIATGFRYRPGGEQLEDILQETRTRYPNVLLLAAVTTLEEAFFAQKLGFDGITTAMYGYTPESKGQYLTDDNFTHLKTMCHTVSVPVLAEGRISTPQQAAEALHADAHSVVVGGAITRPQNITRTFVSSMASP
ncbi:TPA: N-acetylmannosamine-6-phosphate 2-epimerase [Escherichia coli]|nr:N-acetylmannosamine-6-phosphate 2-epimerase [Escherichia coli]